MNDLIWSIYRIQDTLNPDSECAELLQRFPTPTIFNEKAYVFVSSLEDAAEPLRVELTEDNTLEQIAVEIEAYLKGNDNRCILLDQGLATQLYKLLVKPMEDI